VADWQQGLAARLAERLRVVAFDAYGFGRSERNHPWRHGPALWSEQAVDVLDALGIERAVVMGHSAGGVVAAFLAANHWPRAWYRRVLEKPDVQATLAGETRSYRAVPVTGAEHDRIQEAHAAPLVIRILTGFPPRRFVRLDPAEATDASR
jgi:pimeloyl-ACP methyl ester carboxylesterase